MKRKSPLANRSRTECHIGSQPTRRSKMINVALLALLMTVVCIILAWDRIVAGAAMIPSTANNSKSNVTTFCDLLEFTPDQLAAADIGLSNLSCAVGLRGSETLDIPQCLRLLDSWAERVRSETARHVYRFQQNPAEFQNSVAYFKMIMLVTVLQQDFGVQYNPERATNPDFTDSRDLFIHGLLGAPHRHLPVNASVVYRDRPTAGISVVLGPEQDAPVCEVGR
jgi:hypothetical protein